MTLLYFVVLLCWGVGLNFSPANLPPAAEEGRYDRFFVEPATEYMPALRFELTGRKKQDVDLYFPVKLVIKANGSVIQEFDFAEDDFAPCTVADFDFEYGDFKFDGYGGFRILSTSMGQNPSYYVWIWDREKQLFVKCPDLEMAGYMTFAYDDQAVKVSCTGSAAYHEFLTYKYMDGKLTLTEKIVDADSDGRRKVYQLLDGKLKLIEVTESHLR